MKPDSKIYTLVTGANGFIGSHLFQRLLSEKKNIKFYSRTPIKRKIPGVIYLSKITKKSLEDVDVFIHLAAFVHNQKISFFSRRSYFDLVNFKLTMDLARLADESGVKKFIFLI